MAKIVLGHSSALMTSYYQHLSKESTAEPMEALTAAFTRDLRKSEAVEVVNAKKLKPFTTDLFSDSQTVGFD